MAAREGTKGGLPNLTTLFNIFHQAVMRIAVEERQRRGDEDQKEVGIKWKWQPGSFFPSTSLWERYNSEAETRTINMSIFADDTTIIGRRNEINSGVEEVKNTMARFEEINNNDKEEELIFGTEEGKGIRMLGSWIGAEADIRNRKRRAGALWHKIKNQLKHTRMSKKTQAIIF